MRRTLAVIAIAAAATLGGTAPTATAAGNDCERWWDHYAGPNYTTAHAVCWSVQDADNKFRVVAQIYRKSDGVTQTVYGPFKSCNGAESRVSWVSDLYVFVSYTWSVWDIDNVDDGC